MNLEHIAISVSDPTEVGKFYMNILGMKPIKNFVLKKELAAAIFEIDEEITTFLLQSDQVEFEIFIIHEKCRKTVNHTCISFANREDVVNKALISGYEITRIKRDIFDLIFIKDKDGHIFELKEM